MTTFRPIVGYVGCYAINRDGDVLSLERTIMRSSAGQQTRLGDSGTHRVEACCVDGPQGD
jgi:hypothetical protein